MSEFEDRLRRIQQEKNAQMAREQAEAEARRRQNAQTQRELGNARQRFDRDVWNFAGDYIRRIHAEESLKALSRVIGGSVKTLSGTQKFAYSYESGPVGDSDFYYGETEASVQGAILVLADRPDYKEGIFVGLCKTERYGIGDRVGLNMFTVRRGDNHTPYNSRSRFPGGVHYPYDCLQSSEAKLGIILPPMTGTMQDYYDYMNRALEQGNITRTRGAVEQALEGFVR